MKPFIPKQINYLSINHIYSAALFAVKAKEYEENNKYKCNNKIAGELSYNEHISYVTGGIIFSIAFLEALINEAYGIIHIEVEDKYAESHFNINIQTREAISNLWRKGIRESFLDKYDILLNYIIGSKLNRGELIYQNISLLIKLRNYLIHYVPNLVEVPTYDNENVNIEKLGQDLYNKRFPLNPLVHSSEPLFPYKCLSYGCAKWAVNSSLLFADNFYLLIGKEKFFNFTKDRLMEIGFELILQDSRTQRS